MAKDQITNSIMEGLLASLNKKPLSLSRGQEVQGEVIVKGEKELILDLGTKSEGVFPVRDLPKERYEALKVGDKIKAFVILSENESGQVVLSSHPALPQKSNTRRGSKGIFWAKFTAALNQKSNLKGKVVEINKGGLMVEVDSVRGFLPNSQVGFELLTKATKSLEDLVGQELNITVIEVDEKNNRLIFSQRGRLSEEVITNLKKYNSGDKVKGKVVAVLPFGLVVDLGGVEGLVFISDVSWDKVDDLGDLFNKGQEVEAKVLSIDEDLGRANLSMKHLSEDPFSKIAQGFPADEVVKGEIIAVSDTGVSVQLSGVEGLLPASKMTSGGTYEVGKSMTFLVDSVDVNRRRVNLAPFVTSTAGLIYK